MSFKTDMQALVASVYTIGPIADNLTACTYLHHTGNPSYNATTRTVTSTTVSKTINMLISDYETEEIDDTHIKKTDIKASVPQNNLDVTPNTKGTITFDSVAHEIVSIRKDIVETQWVFQLRRP